MKRCLPVLLSAALAACGPGTSDPMLQQQPPVALARKAQQGLECGVAKNDDGSWTKANVLVQSNGPSDRTDLLLWFGEHTTSPLEGCTPVEGLAVELWRCQTSAAPSARPIDPGVIEVTTRGMTLKTEGANDAASVPGTMRAGDEVRFTAAGKELAAFSGTVPAPGMPVLMTVPAMVRRGSELGLSWSGADGARVRLGAGRTELWALVPPGSSSLTLPASVLDDLERGTAWFEVAGYRAREVMAGSAAVCLVAAQQPVYRTFTLGN